MPPLPSSMEFSPALWVEMAQMQLDTAMCEYKHVEAAINTDGATFALLRRASASDESEAWEPVFVTRMAEGELFERGWRMLATDGSLAPEMDGREGMHMDIDENGDDDMSLLDEFGILYTFPATYDLREKSWATSDPTGKAALGRAGAASLPGDSENSKGGEGEGGGTGKARENSAVEEGESSTEADLPMDNSGAGDTQLDGHGADANEEVLANEDGEGVGQAPGGSAPAGAILSAAGAGAGAGAATAAASPAANADAGEPAAAGNVVTFDTSDAALDGKRLGAFPFPVVCPERNSASDSTKSLSATILTHKSDPSIDEDAVLIAADDGRSVLEYKKDDEELQRLVHAAARTPDPNAADPKAQARFVVRSGRKFVGTLLGSGKIFEAPAGELPQAGEYFQYDKLIPHVMGDIPVTCGALFKSAVTGLAIVVSILRNVSGGKTPQQRFFVLGYCQDKTIKGYMLMGARCPSIAPGRLQSTLTIPIRAPSVLIDVQVLDGTRLRRGEPR